MDPKLQLFITFQLLTSLQMSFSKDYRKEKEKRNTDEAQPSGFQKFTFHSDLTLL